MNNSPTSTLCDEEPFAPSLLPFRIPEIDTLFDFVGSSSSQTTSHSTLTASLSTRNNRLTSFSISGASTYFFFKVLRKRFLRIFFVGGAIP